MHQFSSPRLTCRLIERRDAQFVEGLYTTESRLQHLQGVLSDICSEDIMRAILTQNCANSRSFYWIIEDKVTGQSLGIQSVSATKDLLGVAEIGIILHADAEGRGYPHEALFAMIEYAFMELDNDVLLETHQASNRLVCLLAKRLSFDRVKTFYRNGIKHYMTLKSKKDWLLSE